MNKTIHNTLSSRGNEGSSGIEMFRQAQHDKQQLHKKTPLLVMLNLVQHLIIQPITSLRVAKPFDKLKIGDEIVVDYDAQRYTYIIRKIHRVAPTAVEIERRTESPQLTLYSCTLGGAADGREVLVATLKNDEDE